MATRTLRNLHRTAVTLAVLLAPLAARGADAPKGDAAAIEAPAADAIEAPRSREWETAKPTRRGGFVAGVAFGGGLASIAGFPNDVKKIGRERYYTVTGARPSGASTLWIGGALADWFTFGIGFTGGQLFATDGNSAVSGGIVFHIEAFPLFPLGGRLRDVGVMMDAGTGSASVTPDGSESKLVDGGACSLIGGGVFWEPVRFWKIAGGPFVAGNYMWSDSVRRPGIFAGWRMSLYTSGQ